MSKEALKWAREQHLKPSDKGMLLALAFQHNRDYKKHDVIDPTISELAYSCNISYSTARRSLSKLISLDLVDKLSGAGKKTSNTYILNFGIHISRPALKVEKNHKTLQQEQIELHQKLFNDKWELVEHSDRSKRPIAVVKTKGSTVQSDRQYTSTNIDTEKELKDQQTDKSVYDAKNVVSLLDKIEINKLEKEKEGGMVLKIQPKYNRVISKKNNQQQKPLGTMKGKSVDSVMLEVSTVNQKKHSYDHIDKVFAKRSLTTGHVLDLWREAMKSFYGMDSGADIALSTVEGARIRKVLESIQGGNLSMLLRVLKYWDDFNLVCKENYGAFNHPKFPALWYITKYKDSIASFKVHVKIDPNNVLGSKMKKKKW